MPQRLTPSFREKVWGRKQLRPWFADSDQKIGEVWFEGFDELPLLVKFLFTSENLSVQVHPGDEYARRHHDCRGKTEMWHILAAEPGAKIAAGFREPISEEKLRAAALSGEIENLLQWFKAKPGDTFFIPAGTVHAIGAGLVLCEIQQHSDVTYRLYDYGRPRELHLDQAVAVSDRGPAEVRSGLDEEVLATCDYFHTSRITAPREIHASCAEILIAIDGSGQIDKNPVQAGEAFYVAAGSEPFEITGNVTLLRAETR
jgi:mannose-6-phosphate isomerase